MQSRYYNPDWGRFVNADDNLGVKGELLSHNMFAYCENNYANMFDPSGHNLELTLSGGFDLLGGLATLVKGLTISANPVALFAIVFIATLASTMDSYVMGNDTLTAADNSGSTSVGNSDSKSVPSAPSISKPKQGLRRPYIRKKVRNTVENNAPRTADGKPIDPNTGAPIKEKPDLGHVAGHEFWREKASAESEGLTQQQFNDRMNNPDLYQLENPSSNRSHRFEQK